MPNPWGFYDMHGLVWEWCLDWYAGGLAGGDDPQGPPRGSYRVDRGGSWSSTARFCTSGNRYYFGPTYRYINTGFRVAQGPSKEQARGALSGVG